MAPLGEQVAIMINAVLAAGITYFRCGAVAGRPLYLLMMYAKARREDLSPDEKRMVRALAAVLKQ